MAGKVRSILMLGGSAQQVVAIRKAKELGYRTVVCDYLPDNPGQFEADVFYLESTTNKEKMLEIAQCEQVEGVLAYSSDPAAPSAAYVAERLGLPTNPSSAIETMSYKHLFRKYLAEHGFPCPKVFSFAKDEESFMVESQLEGFSWPVVIKPTDSSGSKGVCVIRSADELQTAILRAGSFSRNGTLIAEEYVQRVFPHVIGGDIFVVDGEVRFWGLMSCLRDESGSNLVPCGKAMPIDLTARQNARIKETLSGLVASLGVRFGEMNVEVIVGKEDTPYVLELASRAGGNMIPVQLSDASGLDLIAANVSCAMGENPGSLAFDTADAEAHLTYVLHSNNPGFFEGIEYSEVARRTIYRECLYVKSGDEVEVFDGAHQALGILFARFGSAADMMDFITQIRNHVHVSVGDAR